MDALYLTREEFGLDLFKAITLFSARDQLRRLYRKRLTDLSIDVEPKKLLLAAMQAKEQELTDQIMAILSTLEPDDIHRLLDQYEAQIPEASVEVEVIEDAEVVELLPDEIITEVVDDPEHSE